MEKRTVLSETLVVVAQQGGQVTGETKGGGAHTEVN